MFHDGHHDQVLSCSKNKLRPNIDPNASVKLDIQRAPVAIVNPRASPMHIELSTIHQGHHSNSVTLTPGEHGFET